jgi:hypothetical protein
MPETFSAKQVAVRIGTDAKTLRKFLRSSASPYEAVGQGGRYEFPKGDLAKIKKHFLQWQQGKRAATVTKADVEAAKVAIKNVNGKKPAPPPESISHPHREYVEEMDDEEPTMEELDEIESEELEID